MTANPSFWRVPHPLVLASGSVARRQLLAAAQIPFTVVPADIDERAVEEPLRRAGATPAAIARHLATAKAVAVSQAMPGAVVLGGDQVLALGDRLFTKPVDLADARRTLAALEGRTHALHAGWALARDGAVLGDGVADAQMTMRRLSTSFLDAYIAAEGEALCGSVGAYRLEGLGIQLFDAIAGDHATILGLPLLPILQRLRQLDILLA